MIKQFKYKRIRIDANSITQALNELQYTFPDKEIKLNEIKEIRYADIQKYN